MKTFITNLLAAAMAVFCSSAVANAQNDISSTTINAADPRIIYEGRVEFTDNSTRFDWSGTTIRVDFTGTRLEMVCKDSKCDWFNLWTDKPQSEKQDTVLRIKGAGTITIAEGLEQGRHSVILQKRTEGEQGCLTIEKFITDGCFNQAADPFSRHIEFIGDSYTCGYGTEAVNRDQPFRPGEENCNLTYAAIIGRLFDAGIRTISHSGRGLVRNYDGAEGPTMTDRYANTFDEAGNNLAWNGRNTDETGHGRNNGNTGRWTDTGWAPDIVVVYLGTNDFSCGKHPEFKEWSKGTDRLLARIRSNYGADVPVLFVASKASDLLADYVRDAVKGTGDGKVYWTAVHGKAHNNTYDLGASWHPNYKGHRKVACCMIPYISTITGWELPEREIK